MLADADAAGPEGFTIAQLDRGYFANLIRSAERYGKVPAGRRLRIEMDDAHRTVVRLIDLPTSLKAAEVPVVPVADRLMRPHPVIAALRDSKLPGGMRGEVRTRALRLLDALAREAERRGYQVSSPKPEQGHRFAKGHLAIVITGHSYTLAIDELSDRVPHEPTQRKLREQERYSWSRIPTHDLVRSGRLRLRIFGWASHQDTFRDTKTIDLATRLPAVMSGLEVRAAEDEEARLERERKATERRRQWENVRAEAVIALREESRSKSLMQHVANWRRAQDLDEYLAALQHSVASLAGAEAHAGQAWLDWATGYRDRLDPLRQRIALPADPEPTAEALKPFMRGLSPYGPSDW